MSRTYKDVPYWVKAHREGYIKHEHHERWCGTPILVKVTARDEAGNPAFKVSEYEHRKIIGWKVYVEQEHAFWLSYSKENEAELRQRQYNGGKDGRPYVYAMPQYETYRLLLPYREMKVLGHYADECTDEMVRSWSQHHTSRHQDGVPACEMSMPMHYLRRSWDSPPPKYWRKKDNAAARASHRDKMKTYAKQYNSGIDLEDEDLVGTHTQAGFHNYPHVYT